MRLLEYLQSRVRGNYNENTQHYNICCPFHDDRNPSFGVNLTTGHGKCFSCGAFPNLPQLIERLEELNGTPIGRMQALRLSRSLVKEELDEETPGERKKRKVKWAAIFDEGVGLDYLLGRGLTLTSIAEMSFSSGNTVDYKGQTRPCIVLPIMNPRGKKVGEITRFIDAARKDDRYRESEGFDKFKNLWGIHLVRLPVDYLYVCEGVIDAAIMVQAGFQAVSRMGASLTKYHMELMQEFTNNIVLVVDNDEAGEKAADRYTEKFNVQVGLVDCDCCKDIAEQYVTHGWIKVERVKARTWKRMKRQNNAADG